MSKLRVFLKYWLIVVIWFGLIFTASNDSKSGNHSSRLIGPIMRWLFPQASPATVDKVILGVRKCAHLTEFGILAILLWRAFRKPVKGDTRPWSRRTAIYALIGVIIYASTDEWHQSFVPNREASVKDVLIDTIGGALGLLALWAFFRWRKKPLNNKGTKKQKK